MDINKAQSGLEFPYVWPHILDFLFFFGFSYKKEKS